MNAFAFVLSPGPAVGDGETGEGGGQKGKESVTGRKARTKDEGWE